MTEASWLDCPDPQLMLNYLHGKTSDRKLRLFAVACCRHIWQYLTDEPSRHAVEVAERLADGKATKAEQRAATLTAQRRSGAASCAAGFRAFHAAEAAAWNAAPEFARAVTTGEPYVSDDAYNSAYSLERNAQSELIRDVFGNPFRMVTFDPHWRRANAVLLGQTAYDNRAF